MTITITSKRIRSGTPLRFALLLGVGLCTSPVVQAQTSDATADASADSVSSSNAQSGVATASSSSLGGGGGSGGSAFSSGGNSTVVTEINQVFEGSRNPGRPEGMVPLVNPPALFRPPEGTLPATAASIVASLAYIDSCGISMGGTPTKERHGKGDSGNTDIAFLPHYNYIDRQENPPPAPAPATEEEAAAMKKANKNYKPAAVQRVAVQFPKGPVAGECLGMLSVQSREKRADKTYFFTLLNDAMEYAKNNMRGSPSINLLCGYRTIATSVGVANGGIAGALSPGISNLTSGGVFQGLLGGLTGAKGRTFPHSQLGVTCIVAGEGTGSIDISMLNRGGTRYDPIAIAEAIHRKEQADIQRMNSNGNHIKEKAAVQHEQNMQPLKQESQQSN